MKALISNLLFLDFDIFVDDFSLMQSLINLETARKLLSYRGNIYYSTQSLIDILAVFEYKPFKDDFEIIYLYNKYSATAMVRTLDEALIKYDEDMIEVISLESKKNLHLFTVNNENSFNTVINLDFLDGVDFSNKEDIERKIMYIVNSN